MYLGTWFWFEIKIKRIHFSKSNCLFLVNVNEIIYFSMTADRRATTDCRFQLLQEMRCQNYDMIRFASYRTACKLRYVQKKVHRK